MPRRYANQVHITVSRLLKNGFMQQPPVWFDAVMQHPPLPLPARSTPGRTAFDSPNPQSPRVQAQKRSMEKLDKWQRPRAEAIVYLEDRLRRQFFRDHPFEAFRARTLVESNREVADEPLPENWTKLKQRSRNPTPEHAVEFAAHLHRNQSMSLSDAYKTAVLQFRALRAEHQTAAAYAAKEAEAYGAWFGSREIDRGFEQEREAISTFLPRVRAIARHANKLPWTPEWTMPGVPPPAEEWSHGLDYTERLKRGIRPNYSPDFIALPEDVPAITQAADALEEEEVEVIRTAAPTTQPISIGGKQLMF